MSSALRLTTIAVMLLATSALGIIGYNALYPKPEPIATSKPAEPSKAPVEVFVASDPLEEGALLRDENFRVALLLEFSSEVFPVAPGNRAKLSGSLVRKSIKAGDVITPENVMLRDDLEKLCREEAARGITTVTIHAGDKSKEYSARKIDLKVNAACAKLDANHRG